jgi:DNA polymerase-3 subunit gamma/tau
LESLEQVSEALADGNSRRMLEVVDELERNGHNLQHFSRELSRYFRNLLVARISGAETRLIAASAAQRQRMAEIAGRFSEEDLTRYLALSLDLFKDLQTSLQPRFHMEIGLVRLVQAGRLLPIEQALAGLTPSAPTPRPPAPPAGQAGGLPYRAGPSPLEMDRAKKAGPRPPEPQNSGANALAPQPVAAPAPMPVGDPRQRLFELLHEHNHAHLADAVEHATIAVAGGTLNITAPKSFGLYFNDPAFKEAVAEVFGRPLGVKFTAGEAAAAPAAPVAAPPAAAQEDEASQRALSNPEVQRFRDVFGGEVRKVRNLKE